MDQRDEQVFDQEGLVARDFVEVCTLFDRFRLVDVTRGTDKPADLCLFYVFCKLKPCIFERCKSLRHICEDLDGNVFFTLNLSLEWRILLYRGIELLNV